MVLDALRTGQPVPTAPGGTSGETTAPPIASDAAAETTDPAGVSVPTERERAVEEEILPEDPTLRVNQYIDFTCRGNANNPGPPATQPLAGVTPDTVEE